jgi:aminopeptidase N
MTRTRSELAFLFAHDSDPVSRWDAGQALAQELLLALAGDAAAGRPLALDPEFTSAIGRVLDDPELDGSLRALMLGLPNLRVLGQAVQPVDYASLHAAREWTIAELARAHRARFEAIARKTRADGPYRIDRASIDRRRLRHAALRYLAALGEPELVEEIAHQFDSADNMTDRQNALQLLVDLPGEAREAPLARFYQTWREDPLVLDKWFSVQALSTRPDTFDRVAALARHADFTLANPNRVRALVASFAMSNPVRFHAADGRPYEFLAGLVLELDRRNPQIAARLAAVFGEWRRFPVAQRARMRAQLARIAGTKPLSNDVFEIATRALDEEEGAA